ncbi:hypothetical protein [Shewanella sp. UCD-KL12]|uniref:hypothetical protein n=1 Tax=Shewanella sp. UCD-KL12 TaxID=1917163 RepID=UPI00097101C3|nr:hypothetical protein [Shewanella sp. UCD-KL12]
MSLRDYSIEENTQNPHLLFAGLSEGHPIRRIHTQWQRANSTFNVVSYGIPKKNLVMHLSRSGRECLSVDIRELEQYSMATAITQAKAILDEL